MAGSNPFNPSFGGKPQYFFGRRRELDIVSGALENPNSPYRALFFTGNRGCGKTALLERLSGLASEAGWLCVDVHSANASESIVRKLVGASTKTTERVAEPAIGFAGTSVKAGSLRTTMTTSYDALDLSEVLLQASGSLKHHDGVFITVDEIQKIPEADMENLCAAVQMSMRKGMPVSLMLAGLPESKELVSAYKGCTFMKRVSDVRLDSLLVSETYDAFCQLMGGSSYQVEYAAEMGLEHHLGLTCDPICGLVQVPCIERNAFASIRAMDAAVFAVISDGKHLVSFDHVVRVMNATGHDLPSLYKETSQGGLAL